MWDRKSEGGFPEVTTLKQRVRDEVEDFDTAQQMLRHHCRVGALTRSERGSVVIAEDEVHVIDACPSDRLVDTTGAGDLYASWFLYGLSRDLDVATCGKLGSLAAAEVISHVGARPLTPLAKLASDQLGGQA